MLADKGDTLFWITFSISVFSATFGLAKCLKTGVAGTFQHGGVLDGLCSVQFLLAFLGKRGKIDFLNVLSRIKRLKMEMEIPETELISFS